jgi:hypothetical protein
MIYNKSNDRRTVADNLNQAFAEGRDLHIGH